MSNPLTPPPMTEAQILAIYQPWSDTPGTSHADLMALTAAARDAQWAARVAELERDAAAALGLLARMRAACGDNGVRMQDELEQHLRELVRDAARYRWLRDGETVAKYPYPVMRDGKNGIDVTIWDEELDAAIDAALSSEGKGAEG